MDTVKIKFFFRTAGKFLLCTSTFLFFCLFSKGASQDSIGKVFSDYFEEVGKTPQEKLYLHLDKSYYGAGENIWFKGYLLNAITHRDNSPSNYIYLELVDRGDSVLYRYKYKRDTIVGFRGVFPLPATLPAGDYYLRGYSSWMKNWDPDFFYYRNIKIGNSIANDILSEVIERPDANENGTMKVRFYQGGGTPYDETKIVYTIHSGDKIIEGQGVTDAEGVLEVANRDFSGDLVRVDVKFDDESMEYETSFYFDNVSKDEYSVSFFPEGGDLLSGVFQQVAFKAQAATGFSLPVSGVLMNNMGDTVSTFATEHDGMGVFSFTPEMGVSYTAETRSEKGVVKRFSLPEVKEGIGLSMKFRDGSIFYQVQTSPSVVWPDTLYLVAHLRGDLRFFVPLSQDKAAGKINAEILPDGVSHFLLVSGTGIPVSERLLFIRHPEAIQMKVETDRLNYTRRDPVKMQISLADVGGNPIGGTFSMSVTDNRVVEIDSTVEHIVSSLLLTSDLKGYIENPNYYFGDPSDLLLQHRADLVMLTHGWRRFRIENFRQLPQFEGQHYLEVGQTVSGEVQNGFGKGVEGASVTVYSPECFTMCTTDQNGRFLAEGIQFSDSVTQIIVQAQNARGKSNVTVEVDDETFPESFNLRPYSEFMPQKLNDYLSDVRDQYYIEGGMQVYRLKEVVVKGVQEKQKNVYRSMADVTIDRENMPTFAMGYSVFDYVRTLNGITLRFKDGKSYLSIRGSDAEPLTLIDEVPYTSNEALKQVHMRDVASISLIKGAQAAFFGTRGGGGVICVTRIDGTNQPILDMPTPGVVSVDRLGYHIVKDFYAPTYETPEKKNAATADRRTTIYWNPALQIDSTGVAQTEFYMPDDPRSCRVTIEGVTQEGYPIHYSEDINK